jgi:hypothetical protein
VDIDEAVFAHVRRTVGESAFDIDLDDEAVVAALHQLRRDCVLAKEALSYDTETSIPVNLPGTHTIVRLTRGELEEMIRPLLAETISAFRRALSSSGCSAADLSGVLLAGGSSRIPLVAELLSADLGRSVAVNAHPKHIVALGAAMRAGTPAGAAVAAVVVSTPVDEPAADRFGRGEAESVIQDGADLVVAEEGRGNPRKPIPTINLRVTPVPDVRAAVRPDRGRRTGVIVPATAAAVLGLVLLVLAFVGFGSGPPGDFTVHQHPRPARAFGSKTRCWRGPRVGWYPAALSPPSLAGIGLGKQTIAENGTFSLSGMKQVLVGPFEAVIGPPASASGSVLRLDAVIRPAGGLAVGGLLSVPGVVGIALLLLALAYAESFLRPLRRRRRTSSGMLLGMGLVGVAAGVGFALIGWTLGDHLLSTSLILLCALTGLAGCLALTVAMSRHTAGSW